MMNNQSYNIISYKHMKNKIRKDFVQLQCWKEENPNTLITCIGERNKRTEGEKQDNEKHETGTERDK